MKTHFDSKVSKLVEKYRKAKTPDIRAEDSPTEAGIKILGFYYSRVLANETELGSKSSIEAVHIMRVATRRIRVALLVFSPFYKKKVIAHHTKGIRRAAKALGRMRDYDVFLQGLHKDISNNERSKFKVLLGKWHKEREVAQHKMIRYMNSDEYRLSREQFYDFLISKAEGAKKDNKSRPQQIRDLIPILIYEQLAIIRNYDQLVETASIDQLHDLRLELKKLRYTMTFFESLLGSDGITVVKKIKTLQNHLGTINDADVASKIIRKSISAGKKERSKKGISKKGDLEALLLYMVKLENKRDKLAGSFPQTWQTIMSKSLSKNISSAISSL